MATTAWIDVGYVARAHGVRGTLWVHWHDGDVPFENFPKFLQLVDKAGTSKNVTVRAQRRHKHGSLVDFVELPSLNDAERFKGAAVRIAEQDLPEEAPGEVYLYRLMGALCKDEQGQSLGHLRHIYHHGASVVLGIEPEIVQNEVQAAADNAPEELLVPLLDNTLRRRHQATAQCPQILELALLPHFFDP